MIDNQFNLRVKGVSGTLSHAQKVPPDHRVDVHLQVGVEEAADLGRVRSRGARTGGGPVQKVIGKKANGAAKVELLLPDVGDELGSLLGHRRVLPIGRGGRDVDSDEAGGEGRRRRRRRRRAVPQQEDCRSNATHEDKRGKEYHATFRY